MDPPPPDGPAGSVGRQPDRGRPLLRLLADTTLVLALCTAAYFVLPRWGWWRSTSGLPRFLASCGLFLVLLGVLVRMFLGSTRHRSAKRSDYVRIQWLVAALYLLVLIFASAYRLVTAISPASFPGIHNRVDALYFSMMLISTVGLGDIHPVGRLGELLVTVNLLVDVLYVGTVLRQFQTIRKGRDGEA